MEKEDLDLIHKYKNKNRHLAKLWQDHLDFEKQISKLESSSINNVDNSLLHNLKKLKLQGKDEINHILNQYRK